MWGGERQSGQEKLKKRLKCSLQKQGKSKPKAFWGAKTTENTVEGGNGQASKKNKATTKHRLPPALNDRKSELSLERSEMKVGRA